MGKQKAVNVYELINDYDDKFIESISLNEIKNVKDLKLLLAKLEKANFVVTTFYESLYKDYIMMINNDDSCSTIGTEIATLIKYKNIASKIQRAYNYVSYLMNFENPFKANK